MDVVLQSRPPEYGPGRDHPKAASGHGCITVLLLRTVEIGGITGLARLSYDKYVEHVADYYSMFYKSYQLCRRTSQADLIRHPDRADLDTKKDYLSKNDYIANDWNERQGLLRLILPQQALSLHEQAVDEFNSFTRLVRSFDGSSMESRYAIKDCFLRINTLKQQLEVCLRLHLRSDSVQQIIPK